MVIHDLDLREAFPDVSGACLVLSVLTLQFVPIKHRQRVVSRAYKALAPGGALLLVEKVLGSTAAMHEALGTLYHRTKAQNGYTAEQIQRRLDKLGACGKALALEAFSSPSPPAGTSNSSSQPASATSNATGDTSASPPGSRGSSRGQPRDPSRGDRSPRTPRGEPGGTVGIANTFSGAYAIGVTPFRSMDHPSAPSRFLTVAGTRLSSPPDLGHVHTGAV